MIKGLLRLFILMLPFMVGCANSRYEVITCTPPQADIYWGKTQSLLKATGFKTPHARSISGSSWEDWCYQVKKDGYHDSDIVCREKGQYRNLDFYLKPLKTNITSEPVGAKVYWGPSKEQLTGTKYATPLTITIKDVPGGASWRAWYFQVKKKGYDDSEIVFLPQQSSDRQVEFRLQSSAKAGVAYGLQSTVHQKESSSHEYAIHGAQATLSWEDHSGDELGFKIERRMGSAGPYREIGSVGPNVTHFTDTGLQPGTTYYYRVRAYNSKGHSAYSGEIRVRTSVR